LSVEEQFYLIWPLVVRRFEGKQLERVCVGLIALAPAIRLGVAVFNRTFNAYVLTPCRFDALAMGGLLAVLLRSEEGVNRLRTWSVRTAVASFAGFLSIRASHGPQFLDSIMVTAGISLIDLFFASALASLLIARDSSPVRVPFRWGPLRTVGKYSFAIYLSHQGIIALLAAKNLPTRLTGALHSTPLGQSAFGVLAAGISFGLALASWWLVEKRFLALKRHFPY
jgi:peptidoglycan/LPS O-acetylase OafA/YrhL